MAVKEYIIHYSEDKRKRHYHQTQSGKVVKVMIQLEIKHEGTWKEDRKSTRLNSSHT